MQREAAPLVVRCGAMGDMVLTLAMTEALHRRFGQPVDVLTSGGWSRPLLEGQPSIGRVLVVGSRKTPYAFSPVQREIVAGLRAVGPRPVWIYDDGSFAPRLLRRAGIGPDWCLQIHRDCPFIDPEQHIDRLVRFAQLTPRAAAMQGKALDEASLRELRVPPLRVLPEWSADVQAWLQGLGLADCRLYLIQAGNKRTMRWWAPRGRSSNTKYWPEERWAAVVQTLLRDDPDAQVILLGVPAEGPLNDTIARLVGSARVVNAAKALPMRRLLALQARASGMISVDTGPAHSGAALGCPLVVLFGKANVTRYTPRSPTGRVAVLANAAGPDGMVGIRVEEVLQAWRRVMEGLAST